MSHGQSDPEGMQLAAPVNQSNQVANGGGNESNQGGGGNESNQVGGQPAANGGGNESNQAGGVQRAGPIESYEKERQHALWWARLIGFLHALSRFVAYCNLTWATVVLMGAFASDLTSLDFGFVVCLLLLEGGRLASASFFVCLLMRPLAFSSQDPKKIDHPKDGHYPRSRRARLSSFVVQFVLIWPSFVLPVIGHIFLHKYDPSNLRNAVRIFYSFVAFNSLVSFINLICSAQVFASLNKSPEQSILRYFDTVLENATSSGLVRADDFEFFRFAYIMLGSEFRRNVQPEAVAKNHKQLIQYMFAHRLGIDFLEIYMDAEDAFVKLAAVNMVGFWANATWAGVGKESEVKLPRQVLTKLADQVGLGQVGWAANNSIGGLACKPEWVETLMHTHNSSGLPLLDCLVESIDDSSSRSLSPVRTLSRLYEQLCVNKTAAPRFEFSKETTQTSLVTKLRKLSKELKVHRLRVQAAYLLLMMGETPERSVVEKINPTEDTYWFRSEVRMLELLRCAVDAPQFPYPRDYIPKEDSTINPPQWAQVERSTPPPPLDS